jgi:hypothetical protein
LKNKFVKNKVSFLKNRIFSRKNVTHVFVRQIPFLHFLKNTDQRISDIYNGRLRGPAHNSLPLSHLHRDGGISPLRPDHRLQNEKDAKKFASNIFIFSSEKAPLYFK